MVNPIIGLSVTLGDKLQNQQLTEQIVSMPEAIHLDV